ncbi:MAG: acyltransferase family protein [Planctomycetota bacterium]
MSTATTRRHDLDALRAGAMLLGIVLHAALAFDPSIPWPIRDVGQSEFYSLLMHWIHGFRMPLFFCLSGFFTAMLWRKRGLKSLLGHRFKRIFVPLVIGAVTIVPATNYLTEWAISRQSGNANAQTDIWTAARLGHVAAMQRLIDEGQDPNEPDAVFQTTPLAMATTFDQAESVSQLLELGADPDRRDGQGSTALHTAAMFGSWKSAERLVDGGADVSLKNADGLTAEEVLSVDVSTSVAIATAFQIPVDAKQIVEGRERIAEKLGTELPESVRATAGGQAISWIVWLLIGPVLNHLWFLWFLCWLVAAFAIYSWIAPAIGLDRIWGPIVSSPLRYLYLVPTVMLFELTMPSAFGPDTSIGLFPLPHVLAYYAVFFFFGAMYYDVLDRGSEPSSARAGKYWWLTLPLATIVFPIGVDLHTNLFGWFNEMDATVKWLGKAFVESLYAWLMIFGLIGLFRKAFSSENRTLRYISDASYWLYLAHLPLVIAVQGFVASWQIPSMFKFTGICLTITVGLLVVYEYAIRYTPIGTLLNGPRARPGQRSNQQTSLG